MPDEKLLYKVAVDYYEKSKLQTEIADELDISGAQVSKYLEQARQKGIVNIEVVPPNLPDDEKTKYERLVEDIFEVDSVRVTSSSTNSNRLLTLLGEEALDYILSEFSNREINVGIGWGSTMNKLSDLSPSASRGKWKVVPLCGGTSKIEVDEFNINRISRSFADRLDATPHSLYLPFLVEKDEIKDNLMQSHEFEHIHEIWENLDLVITSVGYSVAKSPLFRQNVLDNRYIDQLEKRDVVGDILSHWFNIRGEVQNLSYTESIVNLSMQQYRNSSHKVVVAGGLHKVESILGLLRMELIDTLITDVETIEHVLDYVNEGVGNE